MQQSISSCKEAIRAIKEGDLDEGKEALKYIYWSCETVVEKLINSTKLTENEALGFYHDGILKFRDKAEDGKLDSVENCCNYIYVIAKNKWINAYNKKQKVNSWHKLLFKRNNNSGFLLKNTKLSPEEYNEVLGLFNEKIGEKCMHILSSPKSSYKEIAKEFGWKGTNVVSSQRWKCKDKLLKELEKDPELKRKVEELWTRMNND